MNTIKPTYYVRHPDETYSVADPQPVQPMKQEPVAYVYEKDVAGIGMRKDVAFTKHVEVGTDLYAAPVDAKAIRAEALEEAAKVCETECIGFASDDEQLNRIAAAIRGLK